MFESTNSPCRLYARISKISYAKIVTSPFMRHECNARCEYQGQPRCPCPLRSETQEVALLLSFVVSLTIINLRSHVLIVLIVSDT